MTNHPLTPRQQRALKHLAQARADLSAVVAGLDEAALTAAEVSPGWTVKDILGHVVSWNEEFRADIAAILRGEHPGYERHISGADDFSRSNEVWAAGKRDWSLERILADLDRDFEEACALVRRLQPGDFARRGVTPWRSAAERRPEAPTGREMDSVETLVSYHWRHMHQHAQLIAEWRAGRG